MKVGELKNCLKNHPDEKQVALAFYDDEFLSICSDAYVYQGEGALCGYYFTISADETTAKRVSWLQRESHVAAAAQKAGTTPTISAKPVEETGLAVIDSKGRPGAIIQRVGVIERRKGDKP